MDTQQLAIKLNKDTKTLIDIEAKEAVTSIKIFYGEKSLEITDQAIIKKLVAQARVDYKKNLNTAVADYKKQVSQLKL